MRSAHVTPMTSGPDAMLAASYRTRDAKSGTHVGAGSLSLQPARLATMIANDRTTATVRRARVRTVITRAVHVVLGAAVVDFPATARVRAAAVHDGVRARDVDVAMAAIGLPVARHPDVAVAAIVPVAIDIDVAGARLGPVAVDPDVLVALRLPGALHPVVARALLLPVAGVPDPLVVDVRVPPVDPDLPGAMAVVVVLDVHDRGRRRRHRRLDRVDLDRRREHRDRDWTTLTHVTVRVAPRCERREHHTYEQFPHPSIIARNRPGGNRQKPAATQKTSGHHGAIGHPNRRSAFASAAASPWTTFARASRDAAKPPRYSVPSAVRGITSSGSRVVGAQRASPPSTTSSYVASSTVNRSTPSAA